MKFLFPGSSIIRGDIEKVEIIANSEEEAINIYNKMYPQFNYNERVKRRLQNAKLIKR